MRQLVNYMYMLILLFVYFEPPHSYGSGRNYFNDYRNLSYNDGSRNSAPPDNVNETAVKKLMTKIFSRNVTAETITHSPLKPNTRSIPISNFSIGNFDESDNIMTSYYSTHVENYPDYDVIAEKLKQFEGLQIRDNLPRPDISTHTLLEPDAHQYRHLCRTQIQLIAPQKIKNVANQDVLLVNYPENFEQVFRVETCGDKENSSCNYSENFPNGLIPICKQNVILRQAVTMKLTTDPKNPKLSLEYIRIPSCCECVLKDTTMQ